MSPALRQGLAILVVSAAFGLGTNALRPEPLPLRGEIGPPPAPEPGAGLPSLDSAAAHAAWENGSVFVDLRPSEEWAAHHVAGAACMDAAQFPQSYYSIETPLDPAIPLVLYGAGPDSFAVRRVAAELQALGHGDVQLVVMGVDGLAAAGLPTEGDLAP